MTQKQQAEDWISQNGNSKLREAESERFFSSLASLNQQGVAHLLAAEVALERCRLATEWKQAVEEQSLAITSQISSNMRELFLHVQGNKQKSWSVLASELEMDELSDGEIFARERENLVADIERLMQAHVGLGESVVRLANLLTEVESCSERVVRASDQLCTNRLVVSRRVFNQR